jgi:hypothetical protein
MMTADDAPHPEEPEANAVNGPQEDTPEPPPLAEQDPLMARMSREFLGKLRASGIHVEEREASPPGEYQVTFIPARRKLTPPLTEEPTGPEE